jgi:hypothetical protein
MGKLIEEGVLSKIGTDTYSKIKQKVLFFLLVKILLLGYLLSLAHASYLFVTCQAFEYEFTAVKEEIDGDKAPQAEDRMYMKVSFRLYQILWIY